MAKKALLVGINSYSNPRNNLRGCLNDISCMNNVLIQLGFKQEDIRMLTDNRATKANIVAWLQWLVSGAMAGDVLLFHYSGHGSVIQLKDANGRILDAQQPVICTYELDWSNPLTFREIGKILAAVEGVNITSILDCCHSGHDFRDFAGPVVKLADADTKDIKNRFLPPPANVAVRAVGAPLEPRKLSEDTDILMAGCGLAQTSSDAFIKGLYRGAFTYSLTQALADLRYRTDYFNLLARTTQNLKRGGFTQQPELEGAVSKLGRWLFLDNPLKRS